MSKKVMILLMIILVIAAGVRLYNPTFRSLWGDECHSVRNAIGIPQSLMGTLIDHSHLPVYFVALAGWMRLFGISELALRLLSVLIGFIAILVIFKFAKELFDEKTALISSFLLALSPLAIMHSHEIRMYGLMMLLSIFSTLYFWRLIKNQKTIWNIAGYFVFTILLALTHIYAVLFMAAQFIFLIINYLQEKNQSKSLIILSLQILVGALVSFFYIKILLSIMPNLAGGKIDMVFSVFPAYFRLPLVFFVFSLGDTLAPWNIFVVLPAGLIFAYLFLMNFKELKDKRIVFLFILCVVPIGLAALLPSTIPKYLIMILQFYLLLIAHSLSMIKAVSIRYGLLVCLIVFQLVSISNYYKLREYHNSNQMEPWQKVASLISQKYQNDDIIIASTRFVPYQLLNYYLNMLSSKHYALYSLQKDIYFWDGKYFIYDQKGVGRDFYAVNNPRIWLITHISNDRSFPPGYMKNIKAKINKNYQLVLERKFIPYEETLVAKLPIKRHIAGSNRITISLYERRE